MESMATHFVAVKGCRTGICRGGALLAVLPYKGRGIEQICTETVKWYRKAAEQGYAGAQYYLGERYYHGLGVKKDKRQGIRWYQNAARQGHAGAIKWLKRKRVLKADWMF